LEGQVGRFVKIESFYKILTPPLLQK
jgi:hypothetical protein